MKLLATFLFFVSATISVQANSDRVTHLGDNASITISKDASFGEYRDQAVRIQLGNYASYSPAQSCVAGSLYIVLDPFAPLDDCYDGYITSQSLLQITPDNLPDLTVEDFKTFSFFPRTNPPLVWWKTVVGQQGVRTGTNSMTCNRVSCLDLNPDTSRTVSVDRLIGSIQSSVHPSWEIQKHSTGGLRTK